MTAPSRIYLSPGMFGFARLASFEYFEHIVLALQERFRARGLSARLFVCEVHPTSSVRRRAAKLAAMIAETEDEYRRLLYVAMTRAQAQLIAWWAPTNNTATSELNRLIFGRKRGQAEVPTSHSVLDDTSAVLWMGAWANHGAFSLERADIPSLVPGIAAPPAAARWNRSTRPRPGSSPTRATSAAPTGT